MSHSRTLLLIGSSIMEQWNNPEALAPSPDWGVVNRAVGGTTTAYWVEHLPSLLVTERPDAVLAYVGSNDFAQNIPAATIAENLRICREQVRLFAEKTPFGYLTIIKALQRLGKFDGIAEANSSVFGVLDPGDFWFDTDPVFLTPEGVPIPTRYVEDELHLSPEAYEVFTVALQPRLAEWLGKMKQF